LFPYKSKIKIAGCPNDCVASVARSIFPLSAPGVNNIRINPDEVANYANSGLDIQAEVVNLCPTNCMKWDPAAKNLTIDDAECNRCIALH